VNAFCHALSLPFRFVPIFDPTPKWGQLETYTDADKLDSRKCPINVDFQGQYKTKENAS